MTNEFQKGMENLQEFVGILKDCPYGDEETAQIEVKGFMLMNLEQQQTYLRYKHHQVSCKWNSSKYDKAMRNEVDLMALEIWQQNDLI